MAKQRFKTKLTKKQKRKNILVFLAVIVCSYAFTLIFGYFLDIFEYWNVMEIFIISLALSFFVLSMLMFPVFIAAIIIGYQKGKAKRVRDNVTFVPAQNIAYYRDNLSELNPSLVSLLIDLDIYGNKEIVATLLRLQNKKAISIHKNGRITATGKKECPLDGGERELLSIIRNGRLNNKMLFARWRHNRFREAEKMGYIKKAVIKKDINPISVVFGILSFIASFCLWGAVLSLDLYVIRDYSVFRVIILFVVLLVMDILLCLPFYFIIKKAGYNKRGDVLWERTELGNETAEKIFGLARFIHEFSLLSEAEKEHVSLWDDYLVYAVVLEENERIVKDISRHYKFDLCGFDKVRSRFA